jgi:hypothetical protein
MAAHATGSTSTSSGSEPPAQTVTPGGGTDMWLVGINAGIALFIATFIAALTLTLTQASGLTAVRCVMWTLTAMGICILVLCLAGYFSQRRPLRRHQPQGWSTATASNLRDRSAVVGLRRPSTARSDPRQAPQPADHYPAA